MFGPAIPWESKLAEMDSNGTLVEGLFADISAQLEQAAYPNEVALASLERFADVVDNGPGVLSTPKSRTEHQLEPAHLCIVSPSSRSALMRSRFLDFV